MPGSPSEDGDSLDKEERRAVDGPAARVSFHVISGNLHVRQFRSPLGARCEKENLYLGLASANINQVFPHR